MTNKRVGVIGAHLPGSLHYPVLAVETLHHYWAVRSCAGVDGLYSYLDWLLFWVLLMGVEESFRATRNWIVRTFDVVFLLGVAGAMAVYAGLAMSFVGQ